MSDLPSTIPLFPLPNAVLFPGVPLPLHVFEPRYRQMIRDTNKGEQRIIGMVLLRGEWRKEYFRNPEIFPVGCAGRMVSAEALPDGRYNILLSGLREFVIEDETHERPYRVGRVTWRASDRRGLDSEFRSRIQDLMRRFLGNREPKLARKLLDDPSVSDELLVNFLCYALDFPPMEKQALLEAPSLAERGRRLCEVVQFTLQAGAFSSSRDDWYH